MRVLTNRQRRLVRAYCRWAKENNYFCPEIGSEEDRGFYKIFLVALRRFGGGEAEPQVITDRLLIPQQLTSASIEVHILVEEMWKQMDKEKQVQPSEVMFGLGRKRRR